LTRKEANVMDDFEIDGLRAEVRRRYRSSPHKKKFWLALLEMMYGTGQKPRPRARQKFSKESSRARPSRRTLRR
jgi:hypothetical protein